MENENIRYLYKITSQEEIFCQYFAHTIDQSYAAYMAGMCNNYKKDQPDYEKVTLKKKKLLSEAALRALKKDKIKKRISEITAIEIQKDSCASLNEILAYLTLVMRKSRENLRNIGLANAAIKAIETLVKRYPDMSIDQGNGIKIVDDIPNDGK